MLMLSIAIHASAATISNDGLALSAYWEFSETTGTTAADSSGNGNDLTLYNEGVASWDFAFDTRLHGRSSW